jgi:hypothetical protein
VTFPQLSSTAPVLGGKQFFRLKTPLASGGDLYESEVSALAFVMGPDSDIGAAQIAYYDDEEPGFVSTAIISPDRHVIGRVDARNDTVYPGRGARKGRILISTTDIWDTSFRPNGYDPDLSTIEFETPILDVIQYFVNPPSVLPPRSDRTFRYQYWPTAPDTTDGITYIAIPAYGRKSGYFTFLNGDGINTITVSIDAVKLSTSAAPGPVGSFAQRLFNTDLLSGDDADYQFRASVDGLWDLFLISLGNGVGLGYQGAAFPTAVTLSDDPQ